jgi:coenzyme F420-dependent glucose-6-phosphate dehydrogenase
MNETPLGFDWPRPKARLKRVIEAVQIISKLWQQKTSNQDNNTNDSKRTSNYDSEDADHDEGFVYYNGEYFLIRNAKLYSPPTSYIPIFMAAAGPESTKAAAKYSNGLITFLKAQESQSILDIFDKSIKKDGKQEINNTHSKQKIAEYKVSYSQNYEEAFNSAKFWRATLLKNAFNTSMNDPRKLEQKAKQQVPEQKIKENIEITTSIEDCIKSIEEYFKVGFTKVYVHSTSPNEVEFIREFGKKVLPYFKELQMNR